MATNKNAQQLVAEKAKVAEYFKADNMDLGMIHVESVGTLPLPGCS